MVGRSVIVKGRVQGVFYRASTQEKANELGVFGWVRNLPNGDVQFKAFGELERVEKLVDWSKKGPMMARVDEIFSEEISFEEHSKFDVRF